MAALSDIARQLGFEGFAFPPPATSEEIEALESTVGRRLPESLVRLYEEANGEVSFHNQDRPELFFSLDFLSTAQGAEVFGAFKAAIEREPALIDWLGKITSTPDGVVRPVYFSLGWVPFAGMFQDNLCLDFDPGPNGTPGQVILISPDSYKRVRIAHSLDELMELMVDSYAKKQWHPAFGWSCRLADLPAA